MQPGSCFVNSFACCILTGAPHYYVCLAAGADFTRWWCFLKVHLSSHVARQIFMSGQVPLAVLAALLHGDVSARVAS